MQEAVTLAKKVTKKGEICLLSPAAASYGFFKNFEEKGNLYKKLVRNDQEEYVNYYLILKKSKNSQIFLAIFEILVYDIKVVYNGLIRKGKRYEKNSNNSNIINTNGNIRM